MDDPLSKHIILSPVPAGVEWDIARESRELAFDVALIIRVIEKAEDARGEHGVDSDEFGEAHEMLYGTIFDVYNAAIDLHRLARSRAAIEADPVCGGLKAPSPTQRGALTLK